MARITSPRRRSVVAPGASFVIMAMALTGTAGTAQELGPDGISPQVVGLLRLGIAGPVVLAVSLARRESPRSMPVGPLIVAAAAMAAYPPFFFGGGGRPGVAGGASVAVGSTPVFAGALAPLVHGDAVSRRWMAATASAVVGGGLLLAGGEEIGVDPVGVAMALVAGMAYAVFALAVKGPLEHHSPVAVMGVSLCGGAVMLLPLSIGSDVAWVATARGAAVALHLGLLATALAYYLLGFGLARLQVPTATTISLFEPLTAAALGMVVLGERLTATAGVGAAFVGRGTARGRLATPPTGQASRALT